MPLNVIQTVLDNALEGVKSLQSVVKDIEKLGELILSTNGKIVFSGIGKSGYIANKISVTLASIGVNSIFLHPAEASHGDLGMIQNDDLIIVLSNSGATAELSDLLLFCLERNIKIISIIRDKNSFLYKESFMSIVLDKINDDCNGLPIPSTSTTMMLVLGDCLAAIIAQMKDLSKSEYFKFHPAGSIGKSLTRIKYKMRTGKEIPILKSGSSMNDAIIEMTEKSFGCVGIVDDNNHLIGLITDGDLRRNIYKLNSSKIVDDVMTTTPVVSKQNVFVADIINIMNEKKITSMFIVDDENRVIGITKMHDLKF